MLTIAYNRPSVSECLDLLLEYRDDEESFPVVVSQDGNHAETTAVIDSYGDKVSCLACCNSASIRLSGIPDLIDADIRTNEVCI